MATQKENIEGGELIHLYPKLILDALAQVRYPGNGKNLVENEMIEDDLRIDGMHVSFSIIFEKNTDPFLKSVVKSAEAAIHTYVGKCVEVEIKDKESSSSTSRTRKDAPAGKECYRRELGQRRCWKKYGSSQSSSGTR